MYTNNIEVIINAPVKKVWTALTDGGIIKEWQNVNVETDWKEGSKIMYTLYDDKGNVMTWNGRQMVWDGIIDKMVVHKELTCIYPSKATGLEKETYTLVEMFPEVTKVNFAQECITQEAAEGYKDGTKKTLQKLQEFLETRY